MGLRTWIIISIVWSIPAALIVMRAIQIRRRRKHWRSSDAGIRRGYSRSRPQRAAMTKVLEFSYDETRDQMTIEGRKYSGDFFRFFAERNDGQLFRFVASNDEGLITIQTLDLATAILLLKSGQ